MDIAARAIVLYVFLVFVMRVTGRRELSALSPVDLVLLIVLGDAIQQGLTQDDYSITGAVIAVSTLATMSVVTSLLAFKSQRAHVILEGNPIVIIRGGVFIDENLRRERLSEAEVCESMRLRQIRSVDEVEWGILEGNGDISFIQKKPAPS